MKALQRHLISLGLVALGGLSLGASCSKTPTTADEAPATAEPASGDGPSAAKAAAPAVDIPGVDTSGMDDSQKRRFSKLVDSLNSPCGEAQSLRSAARGTSCVRGRFAARYVAEIIKDGPADAEVREFYKMAYANADKRDKIAVDTAGPHVGPTDARIVIAEYYDYGCPACKSFAPLIEQAAKDFPRDVIVYYKQYPLPGHPDSGIAAQAAIAAHKQGKFKEMHDLLFANQIAHKKADLDGHAKKIGLDMAKYEADFGAAKSMVAADKASGGEMVTGTPTVFINGRKYEGPSLYKYFKMWIDEELAVNQ